MKADQVLIEHHDVLRGLLTQLEETTDEQGKERKKLLDDLVSELGVHVRIEDELFYPAVEKVTPLLAISQAEHRAIDDQLAVVLRTDTGGPDFATEVKMLAATLHHHAGEEERLMFRSRMPSARRRSKRWGRRWRSARNSWRTQRSRRPFERQREKCCDTCEPLAARALRLVR